MDDLNEHDERKDPTEDGEFLNLWSESFVIIKETACKM